MLNPLDAFTGKYQQEAAAQKEAALRQGMTDYGQYADLGRGALTTNYTAALDPYKQLQTQGAGGYSAYADASGANGPEGLARASAQYKAASPGYAGAAQDAANMAARAGVAGGAATGNTLQAITDRTTQLGLNAYGDYVNRLAPWLQQGQQTAAGLGGIYTGLGQGLAGSYGNQAGAFLGANKDIGAAQAEGTMGNLTGLQNLWNFGLNAATAAAGGGAGGAAKAAGGGLFGALTNNFMSPGSFNRPA